MSKSKLQKPSAKRVLLFKKAINKYASESENNEMHKGDHAALLRSLSYYKQGKHNQAIAEIDSRDSYVRDFVVPTSVFNEMVKHHTTNKYYKKGESYGGGGVIGKILGCK